jgi:hypothetical protein
MLLPLFFKRKHSNPKLREADPGGLGACPQEKCLLALLSFF